MDFTNDVVFVTGAGGGSGQIIAEQFLKHGATVIASDLKVPDWASEFEDRLKRIALDVSDEKAIVAAVASANKSTAGVNVLINNAGIAIGGSVDSFELDIWRKVFSVNTEGTFICTREVVKGMIERGQGGSIINVASIAGKNGFPNSPAYCASKAAVIGFTRSAAVELGEKDITVNAICPGSVDTPMIQGVVESIAERTGSSRKDVQTSMESGIPMKRFQTPGDVASLCMFLASDLARNISGESINLDGGVVRD